MLTPFHAGITRKALEKKFKPDVLEIVIHANKKQDAIPGLIGHSEYHFHNDLIAESLHYINIQRDAVYGFLVQMNLKPAWQAFGRLIHTAQDFYAHSNYVSLWLDQYMGTEIPSAQDISPLDEKVLTNSQLSSGKIYYPFELLSFVPGIKKLVIPFLPRDSHAWMNLDSPASGEKFEYAYHAAVKRTVIELEILEANLGPDDFSRFIKG